MERMILGIETSGRTGGVALVKEGEIMGETLLSSPRTYSRRLLPSMHWLLGESGAGLQDISLLAVDIGPGSFTGLRIGLATAKGLAFARSLSVIGVSSLDAMVMNLLPRDGYSYACPVIDAKKGQVYTAMYRLRGNGFERITPYLSVVPNELGSHLDTDLTPVVLLGDGLIKYRDTLYSQFKSPPTMAPRHLWPPRPSSVALLGEALYSSGVRHHLFNLTPLYVRPSDAETGGKSPPCSAGEDMVTEVVFQ